LLAVRTVTAAALLAGFLAALFLLERTFFALLIGVVIAWAAWEWAALSGYRAAKAVLYAAACTALYALLAGWSAPPTLRAAPVLPALLVAGTFWAVAAPLLLRRDAVPRGWIGLAGLLALAPAGVSAAALPAPVLLGLLGLVWVSDTAAYLVGRRFGRHKLAPAISPGKTVEGALGAVAASIAYAVILASSMPTLGFQPHGPAAWAGYIAGAALLCVAGIAGDLFESWAKRRAGVKDSGRLLPGHGGVLDRIDSACAALPVGALLIAWWEAV